MDHGSPAASGSWITGSWWIMDHQQLVEYGIIASGEPIPCKWQHPLFDSITIITTMCINIAHIIPSVMHVEVRITLNMHAVTNNVSITFL